MLACRGTECFKPRESDLIGWAAVNQTDYKEIEAFILRSKEFDEIAHSQACRGLPGASAVAPLALRCLADAMLKARHAPAGLTHQPACAVHCAMNLGRAAVTRPTAHSELPPHTCVRLL